MSDKPPRLSIELVPKSCWFSNVRSQVTPEVWDSLRRPVYEAAGHKCEICGGVGRKHPVECHEIFIYDDNQHIQKLGRLIALCPRCHAVKHFGLSMIRGWADRAFDHLCKINEWHDEEASNYISACFAQYKKRSQHPWKLDLTHLEELGVLLPRKL